jgi:hypothetical protein
MSESEILSGLRQIVCFEENLNERSDLTDKMRLPVRISIGCGQKFINIKVIKYRYDPRNIGAN